MVAEIVPGSRVALGSFTSASGSPLNPAWPAGTARGAASPSLGFWAAGASWPLLAAGCALGRALPVLGALALGAGSAAWAMAMGRVAARQNAIRRRTALTTDSPR